MAMNERIVCIGELGNSGIGGDDAKRAAERKLKAQRASL
jgi:hypothetical protein